MKTLANLTVEEFEKMLGEFNATPEKRSQMSMDEVLELAKRLNEKIDVPLINETGEERILVKIVLKIDTFLYDNLPNEFYDLIRSADKGIDDTEAKRLVRRLTKLANKKIDIPYLPEIAERVAINFIIAIIVDASRKKLNLINIQDKWSQKLISDDHEKSHELID